MAKLNTQKIVIAGGTGFVGQGIIQQLAPGPYNLHSLARHPFQGKPGDSTQYHVVDLSQPTSWQDIVSDADWVIDAVGILFPQASQQRTYENSTIQPARNLLQVLIQNPRPNLLYISANTAPNFMRAYLNSKRQVETEFRAALPTRTYVVYPGLIFDRARFSSYLPGLLLEHLTWLPSIRALRPIRRARFAQEIESILAGSHSPLLRQIDGSGKLV